MPEDTRAPTVRYTLYFVLAVVAGYLIARLSKSPFAADSALYFDRVKEVMDGRIPYVETDLEHLPISFLGMVLVWLATGGSSVEAFETVFALAMAACLLATGIAVRSLGRQRGDPRAHWVFLALAAPLFPLVLFRNDPLVTVLTTVAFLMLSQERFGKAAAWLGVGVAAKAWPVVMVVSFAHRQKHKLAAIIGIWAASLLGLLALTPGFREGRAFTGVQFETLFGSAITWARSVRGLPTNLVDAAGALYVEVPWWVASLQLALGALIALAGLAVLWSRSRNAEGEIRLLAVMIIAVMVASPLLSAQFILWPLPFISLIRSTAVRMTGFAASLLTALFIGFWPQVFDWPQHWWFGLSMARNIVLLLMLGLLFRTRDRTSRSSSTGV